MIQIKTKVKNASGLHARPASNFVLRAKKFNSDVTVTNLDRGGSPVSAKSIMMVLSQGIRRGTNIEIAAKGSDEKAAVRELAGLIESGCGE